jgi:hypothetical protein
MTVISTPQSAIQRIVLEINCYESKLSQPLQLQFSRMMYENGYEVLAELVDQIIGSEIFVELDTVQLDLGNFAVSDIAADFIPALEKSWRQYLGQYSDSRLSPFLRESTLSFNKREQDALRVLGIFLDKGQFPWWYTKQIDLENLLSIVFGEEARIVALFFRKEGVRERTRRRMAFQFPELYLGKTVEVLEPSEFLFILDFRRNAMLSLVKQMRPKQSSKAQLSQYLWLFVLNYLLVERGSVFNRKAYLKSQIRQLGDFFSFGTASLVKALLNVLITMPDERIIPGSFRSLMEIVLKEMHSQMGLGPSIKSLRVESDFSTTEEKEEMIKLIRYFGEFCMLPQAYADITEIQFSKMLEVFFQKHAISLADIIQGLILKGDNPLLLLLYKLPVGNQVKVLLKTEGDDQEQKKAITTDADLERFWVFVQSIIYTGNIPWWGGALISLNYSGRLKKLLLIRQDLLESLIVHISESRLFKRRWNDFAGVNGILVILRAFNPDSWREIDFGSEISLLFKEFWIDILWRQVYAGGTLKISTEQQLVTLQIALQIFPTQRVQELLTWINQKGQKEMILSHLDLGPVSLVRNKSELYFSEKASTLIKSFQIFSTERKEQNELDLAYRVVSSYLFTGGIFSTKYALTERERAVLLGAVLLLQQQQSAKWQQLLKEEMVQTEALLNLADWGMMNGLDTEWVDIQVLKRKRFSESVNETLLAFLEDEEEALKESPEEMPDWQKCTREELLTQLELFLQKNKIPLFLRDYSQSIHLNYFAELVDYLSVGTEESLFFLLVHKANQISNRQQLLDILAKTRWLKHPIQQLIGRVIEHERTKKQNGYNISFLQWMLRHNSRPEDYLVDFFPEMNASLQPILSLFKNVFLKLAARIDREEEWRSLYLYKLAELLLQARSGVQIAPVDVSVKVVRFVLFRTVVDARQLLQLFEEIVTEARLIFTPLEREILEESRKLMILKAKTHPIAPSTTSKKKKAERSLTPTKKTISEETEETIYVQNAGLVLLAPYIREYLFRMGVLNEEKNQFVDLNKQERALHLLQFLADGHDTHEEFVLTLPKLICGYPLHSPVSLMQANMTEEEIEIAEGMLTAVLERWEKMQSTSIGGLRGTFLIRDAALLQKKEEYVLQVERKGVDVLLEFIPWSFQVIRLPWMDKHLIVQWIK